MMLHRRFMLLFIFRWLLFIETLCNKSCDTRFVLLLYINEIKMYASSDAVAGDAPFRKENGTWLNLAMCDGSAIV
jgi:hypothetical protein